MTDIEGFLTIYGHSDNLLNNKHILLDGLVCSIVGYFYESRPVFWRAHRASQNTRDESKYPKILHTKPSNKGFIIQLSYKMEKWSAYKLSELRDKLT